LAIGHVEGSATIFEFYDVVGVHSIGWLAPPASLTCIQYRHATPAGQVQHLLAPPAVFGCQVDFVYDLFGRLNPTNIQSRNAGPKLMKAWGFVH